jgi:pSer/pThr/pTyr-binding forkhead associated (FHA) protein
MTIERGMIDRHWTVGSAEDCDLRVNDGYISEYHCEVAHLKTGGFIVRDIGSLNGTWIHSRDDRGGYSLRVHGWTEIFPGETLQFGRTKLPWPDTDPGLTDYELDLTKGLGESP